MDIAELGACPDTDSVMTGLTQHGLVKHALELDAYGVTIIPRDTMGVSDDFVDRLRGAIVRACERRNGVAIGDYETSEAKGEGLFKNSWYLLQEDPVFAEAATHPKVLAIARWLLGRSAILAGHTWIIKPRTSADLSLHSDAHGVPPGGGHIAHVANLSWLCTDYAGPEDGPTVFVPGSHRYGRATLPHEQKIADCPFKTVTLNAPAGSLAVWHGATWHGSTPRAKPGLRITLVQVFMRMHMRPINMWQEEKLDPVLLEKYPELETILGRNHLYPYKEHNDHPERIAPFMRTGTDPFA